MKNLVDFCMMFPESQKLKSTFILLPKAKGLRVSGARGMLEDLDATI